MKLQNRYILFCFFFLYWNFYTKSTFLLLKPFVKIFKYLKPVTTAPLITKQMETVELTPQQKYDLSWYVVSETKELDDEKPKKITIWGKDYVIWKTKDNKYRALENSCSHRGVELSRGCVINDEIQCPYHGFQFSGTGNLTKVPGMNFEPSVVQNIPRYSLVEKHGWLYLNTYQIPWNITDSQMDILNANIFVEPEANDSNMSVVLLNKIFNSYGRIVSENSLDVMHIGYVHTFGNKERPAPINEDPPKTVGLFHFRTSYLYKSGKKSMIKRIFNINDIDIDNEFVLPHSTVARVKFGDGLVNTVITSACPINATSTRLFVKSYRNFFHGFIYNKIFEKLMDDTLLQDKGVVEGISLHNMEGKFNMKFDKLQNVYRTLYKKYIHRF
jgi:phenylpropionate dioxygenase-like ring-hydroxylating dioxygenase large terminal subunit